MKLIIIRQWDSLAEPLGETRLLEIAKILSIELVDEVVLQPSR